MSISFLTQDYNDLLTLRGEVQQKYREAGRACGEASEQGESFAGHDNAPFEMAKNEQDIHARKLQHIDRMLSSAMIVEAKPNDGSVQMGRVVRVDNEGNKEITWFRIGSPWSKDEGDGSEDHPMNISYLSPIARVLLGRRQADTVNFQHGHGTQKLKIIEIR